MTNRFFAGQTNYIEEMNALDGETGDHIADATGAHAATAISNTPAGNIAATTVQAAINELDTEKLSASATTLPSSFVNASLNSITPTGGVLAVTGNVSATGSLQAGAGGDGALSSVRSDNTSAIASGVNLSRGNATGTNVNISTTGDGANGVAAALLRFDGTEVMRWQPGNVAVTGSISATATAETFISTAATTSPRSLHFANTGGDVYFGIEGSSSGGFFTGSTAYATVVYSTQRVQTIIGGVKRTEVDSSGITVTGSISATSLVDISAAGAGQIKFPATQNASADANTLDDYQEATYTGTATGMTTSPTGTVSYTLTGNEATLNLPEITGTSNATTFTVTGMPAEARPASRKTVLGRAQDNGGAIVPVRIDIETTGVLTIYANADAGAFTASGSKTLAECSVTYTRV